MFLSSSLRALAAAAFAAFSSGVFFTYVVMFLLIKPLTVASGTAAGSAAGA